MAPRNRAATAASQPPRSSDVGGRRNATKQGKQRVKDEPPQPKPVGFRLDIPRAVRDFLVEDCINVTKRNMIVDSRAWANATERTTPTVKTLLNKCREELLERGFRLQGDPPTDALLITINKGLLLYFDRCLGHNLLYHAEQGQLTHVETVWKKGHHIENPVDSREMSDVYGVEHLLRLLVVLPDLLSQASIDQQSCQLICTYVNELFQWLGPQLPNISLPYIANPPEFMDVVRSRASKPV